MSSVPRTRLAALALSALVISSLASAGEAEPLSCSPVAGVEALLVPGKVVLLGELHGTNESPAFVASLACEAVAAGLELVVGLELSASDQPHVDRYLASAGASEDRRNLVETSQWQREYQDGRNSRAMAGLIESVRRLRGHRPSARVLYFDSGGPGQQRERGMAANVLRSVESHPKALHLILTGNRHSRVVTGSPSNADYEPMGYLVEAGLPEGRVTAIDASHWGGTAWVCNPGCGMDNMRGRGEVAPGLVSIDDETRPSGHAGWYGVGRISASPPASGHFCDGLLAELQSALQGDYRSFDQTPGAGWRKLSDNECLPEAVSLIDRYLNQHDHLSSFERRILSFHAGQLLARDREYSVAIPRFEAAIDDAEPVDHTFKWNAYVRATLAFLRGDRDELLAQRAIVATSSPRAGRVPNLNVVDRLVAGFDTDYRTAYSGPPREEPKRTQPEPTPPVETASSKAAVENWQGDWQAYQYGSRAWTIRIDGSKFHGVLGPDDHYKGTISIRTDAEPSEIDFLIEECRCSYEGQASKGVFRWDGESITLSAPQPGNARPTTFEEQTGRVVTLKRIEE